jgi:hypothetical protein
MQLPKFLQVAQEIMRNAESSEKYANATIYSDARAGDVAGDARANSNLHSLTRLQI